MKPGSATVEVAPKDVILKQELYFLMLCRKCLDSSEVPDMYDRRGSGGEFSDGNLTLPLEQHIPGDSPLNFWPDNDYRLHPFYQSLHSGETRNRRCDHN
jgi:hypothetical protein